MPNTSIVKSVKEYSPEEAIAFFQQKGYEIGFDYRDVWGKNHAIAFTAAKAMQQSILETLRSNIDLAMKEGIPFEQFKQNVVPQLASQGWWGTQKITDPKTGKNVNVNVGASRLKNIFETNLRAAYAEGQHIRIQNSKDTFPYLQYRGCNSQVPRREHCALNGFTAPVDNPIWNAIKPPKGWGCKCGVIQLTKNQAAKVPDDKKEVPKLHWFDYSNPRTGEKTKLPEFDITYINEKGKAETITWRGEPAFSYPHGSYYEHLIVHTLGQAKNTRGLLFFKNYTFKTMESYKTLSQIGYENKAIRTEWLKLSVDQRLVAVTIILSDIKKAGKIDDTVATQWQQHYDNALHAIKRGQNITNDEDKKIAAGEALYELGFLIGMLSNLPDSMQRVVPR